MNRDALKQQLMFHEGVRLAAYYCSTGHLTIGVGHNCEALPTAQWIGRDIRAVGERITHDEAMTLLDVDLEHAIEAVGFIPKANEQTENRQAVLIDMTYNMGIGRVLQFRKMFKAMWRADYGDAAAEMVDSKWAEQVGNRALRLAVMMRDNVDFVEACKAVPL